MATVLAQDRAQASQAQNVLATRQYRKDLAAYDIEVKKYEKEKAIYDAKQKVIQDKKDAYIKERQVVMSKYETALAANPFSQTVRGASGRGIKNLKYGQYVAKVTKEKDYGLGGIAVRESGITVVSGGRLSRSASKRIQSPWLYSGSGDRHVQYQLSMYYTNQALYSGKLAPSDYSQRVQQIQSTYQKQQQGFTLATARTAATTLKSETIKRDTARALAAQSGGAIGSISKSGLAAISTGSQVKTGINIADLKPSRPIAPNVPSTMLQGGERVIVTTPDGKQRTFKDRATADSFVSRIKDGSYVEPVKPTGGFYKSPFGAMALGGTSLLGKSYVGYSESGKPYEGAVQPSGYVVEYKGKERMFLSLGAAEKFVDRVESPIKSTKSDKPLTPLETFGKELESEARYADRVDLGKEPKPTSIPDLTRYYASQGLKPLLDIGYEAKNLLTGEKEPIAPSLPSMVFEQGIEVAKKIWETGDLTPDIENKAGKFIADDPVRAAVQLPAEAALWITGGKVISGTAKVVSKVAKELGITSPITRISGGVEGQTIYKGIAINKKPVIGIQQGKVILGEPKSVVPKLSKEALESRTKGELSFGYGAERQLFYTAEGQAKQVKAGLINPLAEQRVAAAVRVEAAVQKGGREYTGEIGADAFKGVSEKQGVFLLKTTEKLQPKLDLLHGSVATRTSIEPVLKAESGNILRMGDLDIVPKALTKKEITSASKLTKTEKAQGITKETKIESREKEKAIELGKTYYKDFPLEAGQTKALKIPTGKGNIALEITGGGKTKKVMEVVLRKSEESVQKGKGDPSYILSYKIPFDASKTAKDFAIKTHTLKFQALTQAKTTLDYQKFSLTAGQARKGYKPTAEFRKLDAPAEAKIYPAAGREKDIKRKYWQTRQTELDQIRAGQTEFAKETRAAAEYQKSRYPELDFNIMPDERVAISFASKPVETVPSRVLISPTIGGGTRIEAAREPTIRSEIIDRPQIKPRETSSIIKPKKTSSIKIGSSKLESGKIPFTSSSIKIGSTSSRNLSSRITSSKPFSVQPKAPSFYPSSKPPSEKPSSKLPSITPRSGVPSKPSGIPSPPFKPSKPSRVSRIPVSTTMSLVPRATRKPPAAAVIALRSKEYQRKKKEKGQKDFLGNTRTDKFVGLINRKEILVGDKLTAKQVRLDKRLVLNPKKKKLSSVRKSKRRAAYKKSKGFLF